MARVEVERERDERRWELIIRNGHFTELRVRVNLPFLQWQV
jgi:hypothetical protein